MTKLNSIKKCFFIPAGIILMFSGCADAPKDKTEKETKSQTAVPDSAAPANESNWIDVQATISKMDSTTSYKQIVDLLGKPYDEYATPSLPEEYIMFYDVPGVNGAFYWIMLNTKRKTFLYWSGEKNEK